MKGLDYGSDFTGVIVTARRFDRERQREYSITVTATDWAEEPLIGICQLAIQILDQNDNSPKFENLRYECKCWTYIIHEPNIVKVKPSQNNKQYKDINRQGRCAI